MSEKRKAEESVDYRPNKKPKIVADEDFKAQRPFSLKDSVMKYLVKNIENVDEVVKAARVPTDFYLSSIYNSRVNPYGGSGYVYDRFINEMVDWLSRNMEIPIEESWKLRSFLREVSSSMPLYASYKDWSLGLATEMDRFHTQVASHEQELRRERNGKPNFSLNVAMKNLAKESVRPLLVSSMRKMDAPIQGLKSYEEMKRPNLGYGGYLSERDQVDRDLYEDE